MPFGRLNYSTFRINLSNQSILSLNYFTQKQRGLTAK